MSRRQFVTYQKGGVANTVRMALARAEYEELIDVVQRGPASGSFSFIRRRRAIR